MAPHRHTPSIPEHELFRPIGCGAYGEVWLGRTITGQWRAVKIVRRDSFAESSAYDREFAGVSHYSSIAMQHPGLVQMYLVGRNADAGFFYYTMELADEIGGTHNIVPQTYAPSSLAARLQTTGPLTTVQALALGEHLTAALQHLHSHGMIHRDVKPANIVHVHGQPKLADPGLMGLMGGADTGGVAGTPGYAPAEDNGSMAADLFAVGRVLYEAVSGKDSLCFPEFDKPDASLRALNPILLKACDPDVASRYQRAGDLAEDLAAVRQGRQPLHIDEHGNISASAVSRRRWILAGGTAVTAVLAASAMWDQHHRRQNARRQAALSQARPTANPVAAVPTPHPMSGYGRHGTAHALTAAKANKAIRHEWGKTKPDWRAPGDYKDTMGMAMGAEHTLCLCADGTVGAHGSDIHGQCDVPSGLANVVAVAAGGQHSLALTAEGKVVSWGDSTAVKLRVPKGLSEVVGIAAGGFHSLALRADGSVVAWGQNRLGQCDVPKNLGRVREIDAGRFHNVAILENGTVVCWGAGQSKVIEDSHFQQSLTPQKLEDVQAIAAGGFHTMALRMDGTLFVWGDPAAPQCQIPPDMRLVEAIAAGGQHSLALQRDGMVVAWGDNSQSQLLVPGELIAALLSSSKNVLQIAAGGFRSAALATG